MVVFEKSHGVIINFTAKVLEHWHWQPQTFKSEERHIHARKISAKDHLLQNLARPRA
jgi:hypothetical protein